MNREEKTSDISATRARALPMENRSGPRMRPQQLRCVAAKLRYDLVAKIAFAGSGHPGGSLSLVELLTVLYYGGIMKYNPKKPKKPDRDRLVMSKGHGSPCLYVVLADLGFFPEKWLKEFVKDIKFLINKIYLNLYFYCPQ